MSRIIGEGREERGERRVVPRAAHLLDPTMLLLNIFFADHWRFQ